MNCLSYEFLESCIDKNSNNENIKHIAIFDIDSTIMNTAPRNMKILEELSEEIPSLKPALSGVTEDDLGWNIVSIIEKKVDVSLKLKDKILAFWKER
ncbi:MAG: hypothetical protein PQJ46_00530, partial [Spirochaetales bacterium]|nr:hypothetical protein [Spirochaetales bacterium]